MANPQFAEFSQRQGLTIFHLRVATALIIAAALIGGGSLLSLPSPWPKLIYSVGLSMGIVSVILLARHRFEQHAERRVNRALRDTIANDAAPGFATDEEGVVLFRNPAATLRFSESSEDSLSGTLRGLFANPVAVLYRLQCRARLDGAAREEIVTRSGHIRLSVHIVDNQRYLWRIEDLPDRATGSRNSDLLPVPMITVGQSGAVLFMNEAARSFVGKRIKTVDGVFASLPVLPDNANSVMTQNGPVPVAVTEISKGVGRRELYFQSVGKDQKDSSAVFETLPVAMIKAAPDGQLLKVNQMAAQMLGTAINSDTRLDDVMQGLGRPIADWLRDSINHQAAQKSEFLRLKRQDKEVFVQVTLSPVKENGEQILIAVLSDATELKTLEAQFVQSQKMQAIGQLAGGVAHDFNNLLTAISGHCDLLLLRHDQGDQDYGDLVQINQNANRAAALVGQLLAFSRKQTLRPETLDLRDTLADLTHLLNRLVGEKVTLTLSHDPVLRSIRADKRQLEQVIMNLVVNARDAMPGGGEIRIETEVTTLLKPQQEDRATVPAGEYVVVRVQDEGVGIPVEKLSKVFEPFYTTKRTGEGTGLGLSTAYGIVKQSGGYIFAKSAVGSGSVFTLYFPVHEDLTDDTPVPVAPPKPVAPQQHGFGVVLLVEDEAPVRAFASRALRLRGYTVLEAESAEDALKTLEDPDLNVDVFVTDVVMPGMDGPTWVREALKKRPDVRVIFVSGYAEGAFGDNTPSVPNSVFLPKPFSLSQLTETVHQQLH